MCSLQVLDPRRGPILGDSVTRCSAGEKPAPEKRAVQASDLQSDLQQEEQIQLEQIVVHHSHLQADDQPVQLDPEIPPHYMVSWGHPRIVKSHSNNQQRKDDEETERCPICLEEIRSIHVAWNHCRHKFCPHCFEAWMKVEQGATCPVCRRDIRGIKQLGFTKPTHISPFCTGIFQLVVLLYLLYLSCIRPVFFASLDY
ncbi:uncharacterized protein PGTG_13695 [Puccinia graminis f. sp. tritici CRL 75-36-700-3]|uniref:RING-type domain-containing protein n=1 Tax=Puccinia graminis f. sp. tritici (strain CRL 75-36-700-3 / race SCCL) TaxID=418459 RepID=E3KST7_PUCGT|nr:uncharacterized protein PGTG_13695 [Puccinia graminis f. sp. tritici CRL 75-36-700-3]EFP87467.1 hypothetical protein PGTG_13695 [Puccinia graminis f. sp. tritici CRL 75-36-700-3]